MIDETAEDIPEHSAATGQVVQPASAHQRAIPLATGVQVPMEVQGEEGMEMEAPLDVKVPKPESEAAMATVSFPHAYRYPYLSSRCVFYSSPFNPYANDKHNSILQCILPK